MSTMKTHTPNKGRGRGFKSMEPDERRRIASLGGRTAHALGKAHRFTSEEASKAGRIGGSVSKRGKKVLS